MSDGPHELLKAIGIQPAAYPGSAIIASPERPAHFGALQLIANILGEGAAEVVNVTAPEEVREVPNAHDFGPLLQVSVTAREDGQFLVELTR